MIIKIGFEIGFELVGPTPMTLMLYTHPSRRGDLRTPEVLRIEPPLPVTQYTDSFGNLCGRIFAPAGHLRLSLEALIEDSGQLDPQSPDARQHEIQDLPNETLAFLLPSRYCEVDRLTEIAWNLFGRTPLGWERVRAICTWVHNHITFGYEFANPMKSALDVYHEKRGVCRDFTHLAVTFCRCMNIPARYVTGYLGDIGVPLSDTPMDFSGWFEVYLGDRWHTFDARHNHARIGRIVMAVGRDAADVAMTTNFGRAILEKFIVVTDEVPDGSSPATAVA